MCYAVYALEGIRCADVSVIVPVGVDVVYVGGDVRDSEVEGVVVPKGMASCVLFNVRF